MTTRSAEGQTLEFKSGYDPTARAEMAKDMAAFMNALGGVIVIGAAGDDEPLSYPGVERAFAERVADGFADAHARHLSPKPPAIERAIFDAPAPAGPGRVLLAINVRPYAEQIVGARVQANAWRFPIRVGSDTNDLEPAMLPLYTTAVRRNIILLETIDRSTDRVRSCFRNPRNVWHAEPATLRVTIHELDVPRNVLVVSIEGDSANFHRIPLDDIERVWDSGHVTRDWIVVVLGHFGGERRAYHSNPSNMTMRV